MSEWRYRGYGRECRGQSNGAQCCQSDVHRSSNRCRRSSATLPSAPPGGRRLRRRLRRRFGCPSSLRARRRRPSGEGRGRARPLRPDWRPSVGHRRSPRPADRTTGCRHRRRERMRHKRDHHMASHRTTIHLRGVGLIPRYGMLISVMNGGTCTRRSSRSSHRLSRVTAGPPLTTRCRAEFTILHHDI